MHWLLALRTSWKLKEMTAKLETEGGIKKDLTSRMETEKAVSKMLMDDTLEEVMKAFHGGDDEIVQDGGGRGWIDFTEILKELGGNVDMDMGEN
ncbi:hypothetical protein NX059_010033 [Plenodomus lindquistii]|nr:hypothetical protein NX059_010033 [Plenodomus lindquistii]